MRSDLRRAGLTLVLLGTLAGCPAGKVARPQAPPADALALEREAATAYTAGDWQSAADRYAALVDLAPRVAESWFRLGNARARLGQTDPAIAAYREALVRDPGMVKAWHNMGLTQLREAAATFAQMNQYAGPDDPLRDRAARLSAGVADLLRPPAGAPDAGPASPAVGTTASGSPVSDSPVSDSPVSDGDASAPAVLGTDSPGTGAPADPEPADAGVASGADGAEATPEESSGPAETGDDATDATDAAATASPPTGDVPDADTVAPAAPAEGAAQ